MKAADTSDVTEMEKLARTVRLIILGAVAVVTAVVVVKVALAAGRWGWAAATTSRDEREVACTDAVRERGTKRGDLTPSPGYISLACDKADGNVDVAARLVEQGGFIGPSAD